MANLLQMINKTEIINKKAEAIVNQTIVDIKHNKIASRTQMLHAIYKSVKRLYESIGKPNMVLRNADVFPESSDYNNTMSEIKSDIEVINTECKTLEKVLEDAYNQIEIDRITISNLIDSMAKKYEKAVTRLDNINASDLFIDSFITLKYFDKDACVKEPVAVNTTYKHISLAVETYENVNEKASIEVLDGSNGFLGNTHQVNLIDNEIKFVGDQGLKMQLSNILDENSETWLEYEIYKVSEEDKIRCLNLGFNYDEGLKWITDDDVLFLKLKISFKEPQLINTITMSPFIVSDKDAAPSVIEQITISDGKGNIRNILGSTEEFSSSKTYTCSKQYCKTVVFTFSQKLSHKTTIGHMYFKEVGSNNIDYFKKKEDNNSFRVEGQMPSVQNVGLLYDDRQKRYIQPSASYGETIKEEQIIKNNLFNTPTDTDDKISYIESFEANRMMIGIRDLSFSIYTYKSESEYVSVNYTSKKPIESVTITADEYIPDSFDTNKDWVRYYISVNDGAEWHPIIPIGLYKQVGYSRYLINSGVSKEFRSSDIGYIETANEVHNIKVKIEMDRPTDTQDIEYFSPIVYEYKLFT